MVPLIVEGVDGEVRCLMGGVWDIYPVSGGREAIRGWKSGCVPRMRLLSWLQVGECWMWILCIQGCSVPRAGVCMIRVRLNGQYRTSIVSYG